MSSFSVVAWVRRLAETKKAGHCGTLDPDAAGVLPVCVGAATGITGYLIDAGKSYRVEAIAGLLTDTLDTSGAVLDRGVSEMPPRECFEAAAHSFIGCGEQTPPAYSAIKIGGQKLYELARKGVEVNPAPRPVIIHSLDIVYYGGDRVIFDVSCSKGTYIRSLCRDIGAKLGVYMCMSFLLRTESAGLHINDAYTLEALYARAQAGTLEDALIPTDAMLGDLPGVSLSESQYIRYKNGMTVNPDNFPEQNTAPNVKHGIISNDTSCKLPDKNSLVRVYRSGIFTGLGTVTQGDGGNFNLRLKKFLIEPEGR